MASLAGLASSPPFRHHQCPLSSKGSSSSLPLFRASTRGGRGGAAPKFAVMALKVPAGVEMPKVVPKLSEPVLGFTRTAETWNSRACMIGIIGTFIVELVFHRGILQMIGVDVGKGLDLPL